MSLSPKVLSFSFRQGAASLQPLSRRRAVSLTNFRRTATLFTSRFSSSSDNNDNDKPYLKSYRLDGVGQRSRVEMTTNTGHLLQTDVPLKMGGQDSAPQPVETLLAALLGCTQATAVFVGRQMEPRILIEKLEFDGIEAVRDERGALQLPITANPDVPARLQRIMGTIRVYTRGNKTPSKGELDILSHQTELRCPIANMIVSSGCEMDIKWISIDGDTEEPPQDKTSD